jgi:alpha-glucosidase
MTDYLLTDISQVKDTMGSWYYHTIVTEMGVHPEEAMIRTAEMTRDKNRTPMQWSKNSNAGFSAEGVSTWLPVNPNYKDGINVKDQLQSPYSLLNYYKHLLTVRKNSPALVQGEYIPVHNAAKDYFAFLRVTEEQKVLVILNFSSERLELDFSRIQEIKSHTLQPLFSSADHSKKEQILKTLAINPFEVFIAEVTSVHA